jgi:dTDP-4-dehydrorhamnose 3,5-epimerase
MKVFELGLGIRGISWNPKKDERGSFTRIWDSEVCAEIPKLNEVSFVINPIKGTLRGLHFQLPPSEETKVVSCLRGSFFDVMVQINPESDDFGKIIFAEISAYGDINALIIPKGFAHGYLTLEDNTELLYFMDSPFTAELSRGLHWRDNNLDIPWPSEVQLISRRDKANPSWDEYFR